MNAALMRPWQSRQANRALAEGGIVAYPTEAVFGLGCDPVNPETVLRLLALKDRPPSAGLILIAAELGQLAAFVEPLDATRMKPVLASWPGPVTWLLPVRPGIPWWLSGGRKTLAVRVTAHPVAAALCRNWGGALVSTSANLHGQKPATTRLQVRRHLGPVIDWLAPGQVGGLIRPTSIRDAATGTLVRA